MTIPTPFLQTDKLDTEGLFGSFNELASLSRVLNPLVANANNPERQLDYALVIYLILETAGNKKLQINSIHQLSNRFHHRFKRTPKDGFINDIINTLRTANCITITNQEGIRINEAGIRMLAFIFEFIEQSYTFHLKDGIEKAKFLSTLSGLKLEMLQKVGMDNEAAFINLLNAMQYLTDEIKKNIPLYLHSSNALDEIAALRQLVEESAAKIKDYIEGETIIERIDDFRVRYADSNEMILEALQVAFEGLTEVAKALQISSSEVWSADISPEEFINSLTRKLQEAIRIEDRKKFFTAEEMLINMEVEDGRPLAYLPVKSFGGVSAENVWKAIKDLENGEFDYGTKESVKNAPPDMSKLSAVDEPQTLSLQEISKLEATKRGTAPIDNTYVFKFNEIVNYAIENAGGDKTLIQWINGMKNSERFDAAVFLDLLTYLTKMGMFQFNLERTSELGDVLKGWKFITSSETQNLITGREMIKLPNNSEFNQGDSLDRLQGFARSEIAEHRTKDAAH